MLVLLLVDETKPRARRPRFGPKIHEAMCNFRPKQRGLASLAAFKLRSDRKKELAQELDEIKCPEFCETTGKWTIKQFENVSKFVYLGSMVEGGPRSTADIDHRIAIAQTEFTKHRKIWKSNDMLLTQKLKIYRLYIIATAAHGHEGWCLDEKGMKRMNGFNSSCLARITGKTFQEMATHSGDAVAPFDFVTHVRRRRLEWLGHLLRHEDENRLIYKGLADMYELKGKIEGTILLDAPSTSTFAELVDIASDRKEWRKRVREFNPRGMERTQSVMRTSRQRGSSEPRAR